MAPIRPSIWLVLLLQSARVVSAVISTETHRIQRQEAVVDAEGSTEFAKPAAHRAHHKTKKKAKHASSKISDAVESDHLGGVHKRKASVKSKKVTKPASLMRSEPLTDSDAEGAEDSSSEETPSESQEEDQEETQGAPSEGPDASQSTEQAPDDGTSDAQESSEDVKPEADGAKDDIEAAGKEDTPPDGTEAATEAVAISDGGGNRVFEASNATATVLASDLAASSRTDSQAKLSQSTGHSTAEESGSDLEQGLSEASDALSEESEGAEEGTDEELNRGAAQACVGTMIEKCPTDKSDACTSTDAGTCVNVFHKCVNDKLTQCAVRKGKCSSGGATCYLPCTGVELHGSSCAASPVDNCNGGYVSDGTSGMSCMISTADITKCTNAGTCALPEKN